MKKLLSLTLAIIVVLSLAVPAAADQTHDQDAQGTKTVTVNTSIDVSYTITIPATTQNVTLNQDNTIGAVSINDDADLEPGKCVKVSMTSKFSNNVVHDDNENATGIDQVTDSTEKIAYTNTYVTTEFVRGTQAKDVTVNFASDADKDAKAGDYLDVLTFTIEYTTAS